MWPDRGLNPLSTTLAASTLTITPPMQLLDDISISNNVITLYWNFHETATHYILTARKIQSMKQTHTVRMVNFINEAVKHWQQDKFHLWNSHKLTKRHIPPMKQTHYTLTARQITSLKQSRTDSGVNFIHETVTHWQQCKFHSWNSHKLAGA